MRLNKVLTYGVSATVAAALVAVALSVAIGTPAASTGDGDWKGDSYDHEFKKARGGDKCVDESCNEETEKHKCVDDSCNEETKKTVTKDSYNQDNDKKKIEDSYNKHIDKDSHDQDNDKVVVKDVANTDTDDDQTATSTQKSEDDRSLTNNCTDNSVTKQPETANGDAGDGGDGGDGGDIKKTLFGDTGDAGDGGDGEYGGDSDPSFGSDDTGDMKCKIDVDHTGTSECSAAGAIVVQQCPGQVEGDNQQSTNIRDDGSEERYQKPVTTQESRSTGGDWAGVLGGLFGL